MSVSVRERERVRTYYATDFPVDRLSEWLSPVGDNACREIGLGTWDDVFMRHLPATELRTSLVTRHAVRLDIGAVYNVPFSHKRGRTDVPRPPSYVVARELVFDIDADAYDDMRTCCTGRSVCSTCWALIAAGALSLDAHLRTVFGFTSMMYVYSGGRGLHVWVSDPVAASLSNTARAALVDALGDGHLLSRDARADLAASAAPLLSRAAASGHLRLTGAGAGGGAGGGKELSSERVDAVLWAARPRLDRGVTVDRRHLLKAPWSVHPATLAIATPLTLHELCSFDPAHAPRVV